MLKYKLYVSSVRKTFSPAPSDFKLDLYYPKWRTTYNLKRPMAWGDMVYIKIKKSAYTDSPQGVVKVYMVKCILLNLVITYNYNRHPL